jgi:AAA+ ATPase superfamily predicted ATPase
MYFDLQPKSRREDLFDVEEQMERLLSLLGGRREAFPLIVVKGRRRMGKTSLIKTALSSSGLPHLILDGMAFSETPRIGRRAFLRVLEGELNKCVREQGGWRERILQALRGVRWMRVDSEPPWIHFEWERPEGEMDLLDLIHSLREFASRNGTKFILVLDEAQELKRVRGFSLQRLMAHLYDHVGEIQMIVSGSQVGLLDEFLGLRDPSSPLFGRGVAEVEVPELPEERALEFLRRGFEQAGLRVEEEILRSAVGRLGGTMGWLTLFGAKAVEAGRASPEVLDLTLETASELEARELSNFLRARKRAARRYLAILQAAAGAEASSWGSLKAGLEVEEGRRVADNIFSHLLQELVDAGFLRKREGRYSVADPILRRALQLGKVRG